jgi:MYXO-CTERM domain-containing protein
MLLAPGLMGCGAEPEAAWESLGAHESEIVNGTADTTHPAVVAWLHGSKCSATIIQVSGTTGWALTAAHCVGGGLGNIYQGNNHNNPDVIYPVQAVGVHPGYATSDAFDVAVLRFSGATPQTPVLPMLTKAQDNIAVGMFLDAVGYGATPGNNTVRRHANLAVLFESEVYLRFNQQTSGVCFGDSGGSSLHVLNSLPYVAGVHSTVTANNCVGGTAQDPEIGTDIRVAPMVPVFITPYINNQPYGQHTCDECSDAHRSQGLCQNAVLSCIQGPTCSDYIDCANACNTVPCQIQCGLTHAQGKALYDGINDCVCDTACSAECNGDSSCNEPPACYLTSNFPGCQACFEQACCAEVSACAADDFCYDCISSISPSSTCPQDPIVASMQNCLNANCDAECPGGNPSGSGGGGAGGMMGMGGMGIGGMEVGGDPSGAGGASVDDDGADEPQVIDGGCGCVVYGKDGPASGLGWLALAGLALAAVRRRRS